MASSLYYFHLSTEDDLRFLEEENDVIHEETESAVAAAMQKPLPRKPLPETARSSFDMERLIKPSTVAPTQDDRSMGIPGSHQQPPSEVKHIIPRRPLDPRPQQTEPVIGRKPLPGAENVPLRTSEDRTSPTKLSIESTRSAGLQDPAFASFPNQEQSSFDAFSITIIRRDPSSGAQWNVGTVSGRPTLDDGQERPTKSSSPAKKPYFDMSIQLTSPGYTYFRNSQPIGSQGPMQSSTQSGAKDHAAPSQSFDRELRMEGSNFWARQHKRTSSDLSTKQGTRGRSFSGSGLSDALSNIPLPESNATQAKGYAFHSPWGGACKFSTGTTGRSLRCRHTLPNPTVTTDSMATAQSAATVSELRFNLPTAAVFESAKTAIKKEFKDSGLKAKIGNIRQKLSAEKGSPERRSRHHSSSFAASDDEAPPLPPRYSHLASVTDSSDEGERPPLPERPEDEDSRLDLSLGQEKAGGGNRGKRAKLGKLIIHDEGFKMMDLVVAANMGIWWSVWVSESKKTFEGLMLMICYRSLIILQLIISKSCFGI